MSRVFLRPDVEVDPVYGGFYAWFHSLAPATGAMVLRNSQLPVLESFLQAPGVHEAAVANPKLRGGMFVALDASRRPEIEDLRDRLRAERAGALRLAAGIIELEKSLELATDGLSLQPLYRGLAPELQGKTELTYDRHHHASYTLSEEWFYNQDVYSPHLQSVMLSSRNGNERPFILSTPRLASPSVVELRHPFDCAIYDKVFASDVNGIERTHAEEILGVSPSAPLFGAIFADRQTVEPPPPYGGDDVRTAYLGHACLLFERRGMSVITDPFVSSQPGSNDRLTYDDLPQHIDVCILTHGHQDHVVLESLLRLRHRIGLILISEKATGRLEDPSLRLMLRAAGFRNVRVVTPCERVEVSHDLAVTAFPFLGEHGDLAISSKATWLLQMGDRRFFLAVDSSASDPEMYHHIADSIGSPVDTVFIGMECNGAPYTWLYGALLTRAVSRSVGESRRLSGSDASQALEIVRRLQSSRVFVYAMGLEPWLQHIMATNYTPDSIQLQEVERFRTSCREEGVQAELLNGTTRWIC